MENHQEFQKKLPFGSLVAVWYMPPLFGILNKEKSGNPTPN
jgi:hypothetical protein